MNRCLFSAPAGFIPEVRAEYEELLPTTFAEIWTREELPATSAATVWVVNPGQSFVIDGSVLARFPELCLLVTPSTGSNHIDLDRCRANGVAVRTLLDDRAGLETISASAEFTFLLLLNTLRRLDVGVAEVKAGRWRQREDLLRGRELGGKRVGLVGLGRIGRRLARYCAAFGAEVRYHDPYVPTAGELPHVTLDELFGGSDVVCVCCALTAETDGLITGDLIRRLPRGGALINTSRGEVLAQAELLEVLGEREDLRVGLDVLAGETTAEHLGGELLALHDAGRVVVTPHIAGATVESQEKAARIALGLIARHFGVESGAHG